MLRIIKKSLLYTLGTCLLLGGIFVAASGMASGLGYHSVTTRLSEVIGGIAFGLAGLYCFYRAESKSIKKVVENILGILFITWP